MTQRRKKSFLERIGKRVGKLPAGQLFGLGMLGHLVFAAATLILVSWLFGGLALRMEQGARNAKAPEHALGFNDLVLKATGAAYSAFFDLSLSKINFISNYIADKEVGDRKWEYTFWELWVPNNFDFTAAKTKFSEKLSHLGKSVRVEAVALDTKIFRINVDIEGLNTHTVFLTRTAVESDKDALSTYAVADVEKNIPKLAYEGKALVAIIIDDIGFRGLLEQKMLELDAPVTFSILPFTPFGRQFAELAVQKGREIMLHMPMEPRDRSQAPGRGGLFVGMSDDELRRIAREDLDDVPGVSGANNHMGSLFTADEAKMEVVLAEVKQKGLYFIDSRTAGSSRAYEVAKRMGIRSGVRNVFLDHNPEYPKILNQFDILSAVAKRQGIAIAIGHPSENTLRAMKVKIPELQAAGIEIVPPSRIIR